MSVSVRYVGLSAGQQRLFGGLDHPRSLVRLARCRVPFELFRRLVQDVAASRVRGGAGQCSAPGGMLSQFGGALVAHIVLSAARTTEADAPSWTTINASANGTVVTCCPAASWISMA